MNGMWITPLLLWAVVEFVQWLRKRPFPSRMRAPAVWFAVSGALMLEGNVPQAQSSPAHFLVNLGIFGAVAAVLYGVRVLLAAIWRRLPLQGAQRQPGRTKRQVNSPPEGIENSPLKMAEPPEPCWSAALAEFEGSNRRQGLWAKVFADAGGNEGLAKSEYLRLRAYELHSLQEIEKQNEGREAERLRASTAYARLKDGTLNSFQVIEICEAQLRALGFEVKRLRSDKWEIHRNMAESYVYSVEDLRKLTDAYSSEDSARKLLA